MILAETIQTVHTSGINWESVSAIGATIIAGLAFIDVRTSRKQKAIRQEISDSVTHLGEVLNERLETKDEVSRLRERLSRVEGKLQ